MDTRADGHTRCTLVGHVFIEMGGFTAASETGGVLVFQQAGRSGQFATAQVRMTLLQSIDS